MKLSVIIPAYNEEKNLESGAIDSVSDYLKKQDFEYEVLIVDDGSTDNTAGVVREIIKNKPKFRLIENSHGGKALTVIRGLSEAKGEIALFTDMDQATPIEEIEKFYPFFERGFDIVIGSREGRKGAPLVRKISAWGFAVLRTLILGLPFKDTQCGFKAFNKRSREAVFPIIGQRWEKMKAHGAAVNASFDVETLFLAKKSGFKIAEVGVDWHHVGTERVQLINDAYEAIRDMIKIRLNQLSGQYK